MAGKDPSAHSRAPTPHCSARCWRWKPSPQHGVETPKALQLLPLLSPPAVTPHAVSCCPVAIGALIPPRSILPALSLLMHLNCSQVTRSSLKSSPMQPGSECSPYSYTQLLQGLLTHTQHPRRGTLALTAPAHTSPLLHRLEPFPARSPSLPLLGSNAVYWGGRR